nr:uncharacterized protein LOC111422993 [Onthophagus taurus]
MRCWKTKENKEESEEKKIDEIKMIKDDDEKINTIQGIFEDSVVLEDANERAIFVTKSPLFCCVSHITDHLLLSSATAADPSALEYFKITCVMNAAAELPDTPMRNPSTKYFKISIYDNTTADILSHLDYTSDTIHKALLIVCVLDAYIL